MVYCTKCGKQNPEDAINCSNCGSPLHPPETFPEDRWKHHHYHKPDDDGGRLHIGGILIGLLIILIGISAYAGWDTWRLIWPAIIIAIGIAIVYSSVTRHRNQR